MKKQIIKEINRTREIMGLSKLLLTEQVSILKFFMKSFAKTKNVWTSLNKTVLHQFGKAAGAVPIARFAKLDGAVEVLSTVMENTILRTRNNGQAMKSKLFGAGIDVTEEQASRLGKAWGESDASFAVAVKNMVGSNKIDDVANLLIKNIDDASDLQKPLIDAITSSISPKTTDEFKIILKEAGMETTTIDKIMESVNMYGHIGSGKNLEDVFGTLINSPNYQKKMIEKLQISTEFQALVRKKPPFAAADLAKIMGREVDGVVQDIYSQLIIKTRKERWLSRGKWVLDKLILTKAGMSILSAFIFTKTWNLIADSLYAVWGKKKAGLTPDMYLDLYTNKLFLKKYGGYTDDQARNIAQQIKDMFHGYWPVRWAEDDNIRTLYKQMPSILAASQVAYWFENLDGAEPELDTEEFMKDGTTPNPNYNKPIKTTSGTLYKQLLKMDVEALPKGLTGGIDITIADIADELETKSWTTSQGTTSRLEYINEVKDNWPHYEPTLKDKTTGEKYYSRFRGAIDLSLLGELLTKCPDLTAMRIQEDCLRKYDPLQFNAAYKSINSEDDIPVYSTTEGDVKDVTQEMFSSFLDGISENKEDNWLDSVIKTWEEVTN